MVQQILTPVDGSENANMALEVAAGLAAGLGAQLKILHIGLHEAGPHKAQIERAERAFEKAEREGGWTSDHNRWPRDQQILEHMGRMILDEAKAQATAQGAGEVETVLDWGQQAERILHHARQPVTDMIVMGSRGAGPLEGLLMGSVSHKVFHLAPCTCVTVRAQKGQSDLGRIERILVPVDGSSHATKAAELACTLAAKFGASVKFLHVLMHGQAPERIEALLEGDELEAETRDALARLKNSAALARAPGFSVQLLPSDALEQIGRHILARAGALAETRGVAKVETEVIDGQPAPSILAAAEKDHPDLIVMGMRGLGEMESLLVGSVSYKVNHLAPCSCITVR